MANSLDPDEIAHNMPSHLDLHHLHRYEGESISNQPNLFPVEAGLGGSVGCAVRLETRRSRVGNILSW